MGEKDIKKKIFDLYKKETIVFDERDVIYLLIETYKIVEQQESIVNFPSVIFFRNWVAHYELNRSNSVSVDDISFSKGNNKYLNLKNLLKELDSIYNNCFSNYKAKTIESFSTALCSILKDQTWSINISNQQISVLNETGQLLVLSNL